MGINTLPTVFKRGTRGKSMNKQLFLRGSYREFMYYEQFHIVRVLITVNMNIYICFLI